MKKIILLAALLALIVSCKKDTVEPSTTITTPVTQTWNGLYCISFVKETMSTTPPYVMTYDTTGKVCGNDSLLQYYNYNNPQPFPGNACGKKIFNCNQCN